MMQKRKIIGDYEVFVRDRDGFINATRFVTERNEKKSTTFNLSQFLRTKRCLELRSRIEGPSVYIGSSKADDTYVHPYIFYAILTSCGMEYDVYDYLTYKYLLS